MYVLLKLLLFEHEIPVYYQNPPDVLYIFFINLFYIYILKSIFHYHCYPLPSINKRFSILTGWILNVSRNPSYFFYEGFHVQIMTILVKRTWVMSYIKQFTLKKNVNYLK